jgi:hypothetical protein
MEENKLIAEFVGWTLDDKDLNSYRKFNGGKFKYSLLSNFKFHKDWNWLMEAVHKIESIADEENNGEYFFEIYKFGVTIFSNGDYVNEIVNTTGITKLEATYKAVVEFINYYNAIK